ncbi:hypothetical protein SBRCBS47491_006446 [Sporothrix bragantina]|uniref:Integral membrane protein n=1 Tax=Sporothrix bragantina TaxID=671064 RepID=A0ABP0C786_9PEZI
MLSIATLFDDEQRLLNHVWIILLGLEAALVLYGTIVAFVRGIVAIRRRRPGGLRRAGSSSYGRPRHVTIELPVTAYEYDYYDHSDADMDMDGAVSPSDHYYVDDAYYEDEKYHTPTRSRTPARLFNSPSFKV